MKEWEGPTADEVQPKERINKSLLYSEHLEICFGADAAAAGVDLEIVDVPLGTLKLSDASGKNSKRAIPIKFRAPVGFVPPEGVTYDGRTLPWTLGTNQTNKATLMELLGNVLARWVGWVTLYVDPHCKDPNGGGRVKGIRIKKVRPSRPPTFDYAANVEARINRARESRQSKEPK